MLMLLLKIDLILMLCALAELEGEHGCCHQTAYAEALMVRRMSPAAPNFGVYWECAGAHPNKEKGEADERRVCHVRRVCSCYRKMQRVARRPHPFVALWKEIG